MRESFARLKNVPLVDILGSLPEDLSAELGALENALVVDLPQTLEALRDAIGRKNDGDIVKARADFTSLTGLSTSSDAGLNQRAQAFVGNSAQAQGGQLNPKVFADYLFYVANTVIERLDWDEAWWLKAARILRENTSAVLRRPELGSPTSNQPSFASR